MSKRDQLIYSAAKIITEKGINHLTLDAVAAEAGVSKGGLIYHFSSKDEIIKALNEHAYQQFQLLLNEELENGKSYTYAYLITTLNQMDMLNNLSTEASMLAAVATKKEFLNMWVDEYERFREKSAADNIPFELAMTIRLVCDGFMFSNLFGIDPLSQEERERVIRYLAAKLKEEEKN